jgi:hypothetical protein
MAPYASSIAGRFAGQPLAGGVNVGTCGCNVNDFRAGDVQFKDANPV